MSEPQWSLVMTEFQGGVQQWKRLDEAAQRVFDRRGLDAFTLVCGRDMLPAELAISLPYNQAVQMAEALGNTSAKVEVVPTAEVVDVRYRANEVWADHTMEEFNFSEIDGMIFCAPALNSRRNLAVLRGVHQAEWRNWQYERGMNHVHADASWTELSPRERVREEGKLSHRYERILRTVYPGTPFVLSHIVGNSVTFYQPTGGAPTTDIPPENRDQPKIWCVRCHHSETYHLRTERDPEFPNADWGDCLVCGDEVLVAGGETLRLINPE